MTADMAVAREVATAAAEATVVVAATAAAKECFSRFYQKFGIIRFISLSWS